MNRKLRVLKVLRNILTKIEACEWSLEVLCFSEEMARKDMEEITLLKARYNHFLTKLGGF